MGVERKKIRGIKVEHNWKLLLVIIVLIIVLVFIIYKIKNNPDDSAIPNSGKCYSDEECVKVQVGCCGCNMGGEETCVLGSESKSYEDKLKECSKTALCSAVYACEIKACSCEENKCVPVL